MKKKNERKNVKILPNHWKKLKQLAVNQDMTIQAEVDAILGSFLACCEDSKQSKGEK